MHRIALVECPVCLGKGRIQTPFTTPPAAGQKPVSKTKERLIRNTIMAKLLREAGYSLREIARFLNYGSPRSVQLCLAREVE